MEKRRPALRGGNDANRLVEPRPMEHAERASTETYQAAPCVVREERLPADARQ